MLADLLLQLELRAQRDAVARAERWSCKPRASRRHEAGPRRRHQRQHISVRGRRARRWAEILRRTAPIEQVL